MRSRVLRLKVVLAMLGLGCAPVHGQDLAAVLERQPLSIIVGSPPGGSYDFYARAIARHIGQHLPGKPSVIVQHMPGGGGYEAANHLYASAPKDGSVIATFSRSVPMQPLLDRTGVRFEPAQLAWIGSPSDEVGVALAWHASGLKSVEDVRRKGMTVAATGPGTDSNAFARVVANALGLNIKIVTGYRGAADMLLAAERQEVDGAIGLSWSSVWPARKDWVEAGKVSFLIQLGLQSGVANLKGVPLIVDLVQDAADRRALEVIFARQTMAYPYAAPPGVPAASLGILRAAFAATLKDAQFLAEAEKAGMTIRPVPHEQMAEIVGRVYASPADMIERIKTLMAEPRKQ